MTVCVAGGLRQGLPFIVEQHHFDGRLRRAVFQALGKDIQPVMVAVRRQTNIAEGKQRGGIAVVVMPGLIHHRDINPRLLQRLDIPQRQEQFFASIARRVKIETSGIHQIRKLQQIVGFPVGKGTAVLPLADERRQRLGFNAVEIHIDVIDVERHHRQPFDHLARQQRAAAGKSDARFDVAGGDGFFVVDAKGIFVQPLQAALNGHHQVTVRLQMPQAQLFQVWCQLPCTIDLAAFFVYHMHPVRKILCRIERHGEGQHQRGGAVELNFRRIQ
ncbi:hypothetical protein D3C75_554220 [compost metagenome]